MGLLDHLAPGAPTVPRTLYWRYLNKDQRAVRDGDWKYLPIMGHAFLFSVVADPLERANLKDREPEVFARLVRQWEAWNATMLPFTGANYSYDLSGEDLADHYGAPPTRGGNGGAAEVELWRRSSWSRSHRTAAPCGADLISAARLHSSSLKQLMAANCQIGRAGQRSCVPATAPGTRKKALRRSLLFSAKSLASGNRCGQPGLRLTSHRLPRVHPRGRTWHGGAEVRGAAAAAPDMRGDATLAEDFDKAALDYHRYPTPGKLSVEPTKRMATQRDLALAYSPGVAAACKAIVADPEAARDLTARGNLVAVISNGTAVLGLGNIGALAGKPVMEGKAVLFKKFAGIDVFDIEVDAVDPERFIDVVAALEPTFGADQPRGHQGARVFRDRAAPARAHEDPGLPRRPARHRDRLRGGAASTG